MLKAVVLAAGRGTRLGGSGPKALTPLGGRTLLDWQLEVLRQGGVERLAVVAGAWSCSTLVRQAQFFHHIPPHPANMVETLAQVAGWVLQDDSPVVVGYGDIVYEPRILSALLAGPVCGIRTVVDRSWLTLWKQRFVDPLSDAEILVLEGGRVTRFGGRPRSLDSVDGRYIGLTLWTSEAFRAFLAYRSERRQKGLWSDRIDMTTLLQELIARGMRVDACLVQGGWLEVDTPRDLEVYEAMVSGDALHGWMTWPPASVRARGDDR